MSDVAAMTPLVAEVLSGRNRELQKLAAQGILPLPAEELVFVQVQLALGEDAEIASQAAQALKGLDFSFLHGYLRQDAPPVAIEYFANTIDDAPLLEVIVQRRDVSDELLQAMAPRLNADLQEILLLRQDRIVDNPEILEALEKNPVLSSYSRRKISEYRQHLLGRPVSDESPPVPTEEVPAEAEAVDVELQEAIERVREEVEPEGEQDEWTGLSEAQIRSLPSPLRVKLARGAPRSLRSLLIRDQNPMVATSVLQHSAVTDQEIESASANRNIVEEVLMMISKRREWVGKYAIMHNLVKNPRTPAAVAIRMLSRLSVRDLGLLRRDRNVSDAVRQQANRVFQVKNR